MRRMWIVFVVVVLVVPAALFGQSSEKPPDPHWSTTKILVVEDSTDKPVAGARIEQLCKGCVHAGERAETDTNGVARVMIYDTWVALKATHDVWTNSVLIYGSNAVSRFRTNAVIRLKKDSK